MHDEAALSAWESMRLGPWLGPPAGGASGGSSDSIKSVALGGAGRPRRRSRGEAFANIAKCLRVRWVWHARAGPDAHPIPTHTPFQARGCPTMLHFFAAADGIAGPALEDDGDHWLCLCPVGEDGQRVALGSAQASYCVLDTRPSQGYPVLKAWRADEGEARRELEALRHCGATGQFWALERGRLASGAPGSPQGERWMGPAYPPLCVDALIVPCLGSPMRRGRGEGRRREERLRRRGGGRLHGAGALRRHRGRQRRRRQGLGGAELARCDDWVSRRACRGCGVDGPCASSLADRSTHWIHSIGPDGTVAVALEGGVMELWAYSAASASLERRQVLQLGSVLGIRCVRVCIHSTTDRLLLVQGV